MPNTQSGQFVPYDTLSPGWEAVYTGETSSEPVSEPGLPIARVTDDQGNVLKRWSVWTWLPGEDKWDDEVRLINAMQHRLGPLDNATRRIRAHIGSLVPCDSGFPVTVDELLNGIGRGVLETPVFHNGCWCCALWEGTAQDALVGTHAVRPRLHYRGAAVRDTQPGQVQSMDVIEEVLRGYLAGVGAETLTADFPHAAGFIRRTFEWLGPRSKLSNQQRLLLDKMLLQFDFYTRRNGDREAVSREALDEGGGRGAEFKAQFSALAGLPEDWDANWEELKGTEKEALCNLWWRVDGNIYYTLCDCHHSSFHYIEEWIYAIAKMRVQPIPGRKAGAERARLGQALFGYVLALDKWLLGEPMQFLLMDLGHADLGFDPKNEVLRAYAHLGEERTAVKEWLAACLWYTLMYNRMFGNTAGLERHPELIERGREAGISVRQWMDARMS